MGFWGSGGSGFGILGVVSSLHCCMCIHDQPRANMLRGPFPECHSLAALYSKCPQTAPPISASQPATPPTCLLLLGMKATAATSTLLSAPDPRRLVA